MECRLEHRAVKPVQPPKQLNPLVRPIKDYISILPENQAFYALSCNFFLPFAGFFLHFFGTVSAVPPPGRKKTGSEATLPDDTQAVDVYQSLSTRNSPSVYVICPRSKDALNVPSMTMPASVSVMLSISMRR